MGLSIEIVTLAIKILDDRVTVVQRT